MSRARHPTSTERGAAKARRRTKERRQAWIVLTVLALAMAASVASWAVFFSAWTPATMGQAPTFTLPSSTGDPVSLADFLGRQDVVLIFYMVASEAAAGASSGSWHSERPTSTARAPSCLPSAPTCRTISGDWPRS
jgi:hypothetical protein